MDYNEKEKRIKEQRLIEATRKGLTGLEGKFGCILRNIGTPIIAHGGSWFESSELEDVWSLPEDKDEEIPTMDIDESIMETGRFFEGLTKGMHLEIKYMSDSKDLVVYYKGYIVYHEVSGELDCYIPNREWETHIDNLFALAKKKESAGRKETKIINKQEAERQKLSFLDKLRLKWGV